MTLYSVYRKIGGQGVFYVKHDGKPCMVAGTLLYRIRVWPKTGYGSFARMLDIRERELRTMRYEDQPA